MSLDLLGRKRKKINEAINQTRNTLVSIDYFAKLSNPRELTKRLLELNIYGCRQNVESNTTQLNTLVGKSDLKKYTPNIESMLQEVYAEMYSRILIQLTDFLAILPWENISVNVISAHELLQKEIRGDELDTREVKQVYNLNDWQNAFISFKESLDKLKEAKQHIEQICGFLKQFIANHKQISITNPFFFESDVGTMLDRLTTDLEDDHLRQMQLNYIIASLEFYSRFFKFDFEVITKRCAERLSSDEDEFRKRLEQFVTVKKGTVATLIETCSRMANLSWDVKRRGNERERTNLAIIDHQSQHLLQQIEETSATILHIVDDMTGLYQILDGYEKNNQEEIIKGARKYNNTKSGQNYAFCQDTSDMEVVHGIVPLPHDEKIGWVKYARGGWPIWISPQSYFERLQKILSDGIIPSEREDSPFKDNPELSKLKEVWFFNRAEVKKSRYGPLNLIFQINGKYAVYRGQLAESFYKRLEDAIIRGKVSTASEYCILTKFPIKERFIVALNAFFEEDNTERSIHRTNNRMKTSDYYKEVKRILDTNNMSYIVIPK